MTMVFRENESRICPRCRRRTLISATDHGIVVFAYHHVAPNYYCAGSGTVVPGVAKIA
jgi:hypothetical protein